MNMYAWRAHRLQFESLECRRLLAKSAELELLTTDGDGNVFYECSRESCPNWVFDSTVPGGSNNWGFTLRNVGNADARNIEYSLTGDDTPETFEVMNCSRNVILANTNCGVTISFQPPAEDPVGSFYTATYTVSYPVPGNQIESLIMVVTGESRGNEAPQADAGLGYTGEEDQAILFDASGSSDPDGDPLTYTWDFGDGTIHTTRELTASHMYEYGGTFDVSLTVDDGFGGVAAATTTASVNEVNDVPVANAGGPYSGELGAMISFDASASSDFDNLDGSTTNDQQPTYHWDFGDGQSVTTTDPQFHHEYTVEGTYAVSLSVSDGITTSVVAGTTAIVSSASTGSANDIYIWDVDRESKRRGKNTDYRIVLDIQRDSDANGARSGSDAGAEGVIAVVTLRDSSGTLVGTYAGTTDSNGIFRSSWIRGLTGGENYTAEVELSHPSYVWNHLIDLAFADDDEDGLPEYLMSIP